MSNQYYKLLNFLNKQKSGGWNEAAVIEQGFTKFLMEYGHQISLTANFTHTLCN